MGSPGQPISVGIDLGTTYTSVAVVADRKVVLLKQASGARMIPSIVSFRSANEVLVGEPALERLATAPSRTVASPKRLLGRAYQEREVQTFLAQQPYLAERGPDGSPLLKICEQSWAVPQICGYLLTQMRQTAEAFCQAAVQAAVIAVPVSYAEPQLEAMRRAASLAGFKRVEFIDEPTAAAVANRYAMGFGGIIGIYDFGGGTFDFSIVDVTKDKFEVLATAGDPWLGGDDLDVVLAEAAANQFWRQHKVDLRRQAVEWQRVRRACEGAKRELAQQEQATIHVPDVLRTASGMVALELGLDRRILARAAMPLIARSLETCDQALAQAGLAASDLSSIYLCGGTCHLPQVRQAVEAHFGVPIRTGIAPDQAVCLGAGIEASLATQRRARGLRAATIPP